MNLADLVECFHLKSLALHYSHNSLEEIEEYRSQKNLMAFKKNEMTDSMTFLLDFREFVGLLHK